MSTLHHESILEECYDTAYEEYRISKGIAPKEFYFIMDRDSATYDESTRLAVETLANQLFEDSLV